jgi:hypothetical protein
MVPTEFFGEDEHPKIKAAVEDTFTGKDATIVASLVTKSGKKIPHVYTAKQTVMGDKPVLMCFGIIWIRHVVEQK